MMNSKRDMQGFEPFFRRVREAAGIESQVALADALGVNRSAVTQAKRRDTVPEKWILRLARDYGLDPAWLQTGERAREAVSPACEPEVIRVPRVRARLSAGGGSFATAGNVAERVPFDWAWLRRLGIPESMVLMDVTGNSMEPELKEGDTVLIDESQKDIYAYGVYAVGVEDTILVKRMEKRPGSLVLLSDNTDYSPIVLRGDEVDTVRVIGRVIWSCRVV